MTTSSPKYVTDLGCRHLCFSLSFSLVTLPACLEDAPSTFHITTPKSSFPPQQQSKGPSPAAGDCVMDSQPGLHRDHCLLSSRRSTEPSALLSGTQRGFAWVLLTGPCRASCVLLTARLCWVNNPQQQWCGCAQRWVFTGATVPREPGNTILMGAQNGECN